MLLDMFALYVTLHTLCEWPVLVCVFAPFMLLSRYTRDLSCHARLVFFVTSYTQCMHT